jgi:hypothetical protein
LVAGLRPLLAARQRRQPALIIGAAHDWQVPPEQARELVRAAANEQAEVWIAPDANHLFLADPDQHPGDYIDLPSMAVIPEVLGRVADWGVVHVAGAERTACFGVSFGTRCLGRRQVRCAMIRNAASTNVHGLRWLART